MPMTVDMSGLYAAIAEKARTSKYTEAECINQAAKTIVLGSSTGDGLVQLTRKATKERIAADLDKPVTGRVGGRVETKPRIFWLALRALKHSGQPFTPANVRTMCKRIKAARIKSRAYIAAGWLHAGRDLAKFVPGQKLTRVAAGQVPMRSDGTAALSKAIPATGNHLTARVENYSRGSEIVVTEADYQRAINNARSDIQVYLAERMTNMLATAFAKGRRAA